MATEFALLILCAGLAVPLSEARSLEIPDAVKNSGRYQASHPGLKLAAGNPPAAMMAEGDGILPPGGLSDFAIRAGKVAPHLKGLSLLPGWRHLGTAQSKRKAQYSLNSILGDMTRVG